MQGVGSPPHSRLQSPVQASSDRDCPRQADQPEGLHSLGLGPRLSTQSLSLAGQGQVRVSLTPRAGEAAFQAEEPAHQSPSEATVTTVSDRRTEDAALSQDGSGKHNSMDQKQFQGVLFNC